MNALRVLVLLGLASAGQEPRPAPAPAAQLTAQHPAPLVAHGTLELPGVEGRIDHLAIDLARHRLFVAALGNDSVEVLDLEHGRHERSLGGIGEAQGILYLADCDRMLVTSGEAGTCEVFDGATLTRVARVEVGADADNLRYDARAKRVYVAYGAGALGVIDPASWTLVGSIALDGHPEAFQLDAAGTHAWVNVPGARQLACIDLEARSVTARWKLDEAGANYPMALLPGPTLDASALVLAGCRSPARLVVREARTGEKRAVHELSGDVDDLFLDARRQRVLAICGAGSVDVFTRDDAGLHALAHVSTAPGARTGLLVPELDQLFVAVPHRDAQRAEVRVFALQD